MAGGDEHGTTLRTGEKGWTKPVSEADEIRRLKDCIKVLKQEVAETSMENDVLKKKLAESKIQPATISRDVIAHVDVSSGASSDDKTPVQADFEPTNASSDVGVTGQVRSNLQSASNPDNNYENNPNIIAETDSELVIPIDESTPQDKIALFKEVTNNFVSVHQLRIEIKEGDTGHGYTRVFEPYLKNAKIICIEDPWAVKKDQQMKLFKCFCELAVCCGITRINLITLPSKKGLRQLKELKKYLKSAKVQLTWKFWKKLHYRIIRLDNGFRIIIDRGLDFYNGAPEHPVDMASDDHPCRKTTIVIEIDKTLWNALCYAIH